MTPALSRHGEPVIFPGYSLEWTEPNSMSFAIHCDCPHLTTTTQCTQTFDWASGAFKELAALGLLFLGHPCGPFLPIAAPELAEGRGLEVVGLPLPEYQSTSCVVLDAIASSVQVLNYADLHKKNSDLEGLNFSKRNMRCLFFALNYPAESCSTGASAARNSPAFGSGREGDPLYHFKL